MSYVYELLMQWKNYEDDELQNGLDLWHSLYTVDGLKSTWRATYKEWLMNLADNNGLIEGVFLECWIQDNLEEAVSGGILDRIDYWFSPFPDTDSEEEAELVAA